MPSTQQANPSHVSTQPCFAGLKRNQRRARLWASSRPGKLVQYLASAVQHVVIGMLIFMLVLPPAFAGGIVADPNAPANNRPGMDSAPNGVPVVNIVAPNQSGLSHNKYSDFNVQKQGAILNNSAREGVSQLGGIVTGNPNIAGSRPASAILNEVTSSNRSYIQGYIEVFGQKADVILANPNGVTINGGGFLNTNRATVTTGKPVLDGNGAIQKFDVRQGTVNVEGLGINASNVTGFDIISRAAEINAEVYAQDLNVVAGANSYDVKTGKPTALQPDGSPAPAVAIDSSALGGMYAGKITLVSTEKGVGVNLQGLVQAESDLAITSEGKLTVRAAKAGNNIAVKAGNNDITVRQAVLAGNALSMEGGNIAGNAATVHAGGNLFLRANDAITFGENSLLEAINSVDLRTNSFSLTGGSALQANNIDASVQKADIQGSQIAGKNNVLLQASGTVTMHDDALIAADGMVNVNAGALYLAGGSAVQANTVFVNAAELFLENAILFAELDMTVNSQQGTGRTANVHAGRNLGLQGGEFLLENDSIASAGNTATVTANSFMLTNNSALAAKNEVKATVGLLSVNDGSLIQGKNLILQGNEIALDNAKLHAEEDMAITGGQFVANESMLSSNGNITLSTEKVTATGQAVGDIASVDLRTIKGGIFANNNLFLEVTDSALFQGGFYGAGGTLTVSGKTIQAKDATALYAGQAALLSADETLSLQNSNLVSDGSTLLQGKNISLQQSGINGWGAFTVKAVNDLVLSAASSLLGANGLEIWANSITNAGLIYSGADLAFRVKEKLANIQGANILAQGSIVFSGHDANTRMGKLHNQSSFIESLGGDITLDVNELFNDGGDATVRTVNIGTQYHYLGWQIPGSYWGPSQYLSGFDEYGNKLYLPESAGVIGYGTIRDYDWDGAKREVNEYVQTMAELYGITPDLPFSAYILKEWITLTQDELVGNATPASIMSAGNMWITADSVHNKLSTISAGENLSITAGSLRNEGLELFTNAEGERLFADIQTQGVAVESCENCWTMVYSADLITSSVLFSSHSLLSVIPSTITAGSQLVLDVADQFNNAVLQGGEEYIGGSAASPTFSGMAVTGSISPKLIPSVDDEKGKIVFPPLGTLFTLSQSNTHPYLIETDPRLTSMGLFYGSDYFFSRLGINMDALQTQLLGDAFYETRMVREQILAQAGKRYLFEGVQDDAETMRRLMDNAADEGQALGLSVGVALTADQIANLTKDIVWLEEQTYMGQQVLVPRLYLAEATRATVSPRGAIISGETVAVSTNRLTNSGLITGNQVQLASTGDLVNRGGDIKSSGLLVANTDGSLYNISGSMRGDDVRLSAAKDIFVQTAVTTSATTSRGGNGGASSITNARSLMHQQAEITSTGSLQMQAGNNITLSGAKVAGEGLTQLAAGNDIAIASQTASTSHSMTTNGEQRGEEYSTPTTDTFSVANTGTFGSSVSGGNLAISAGNNVAITGSQVKARENALLAAGNNITVTAAENSKVQQTGSVRDNGNNRQTKRTETTQLTASGIEAGKGLVLDAGNDIKIAGSKVRGTEAVVLAAGNDVTISSQASGSTTTKTSERYSSIHDKQYNTAAVLNQNIQQSSSEVSGGEVRVQAGRDTNIIGSTLAAKQDLSVEAGRDINVSAAEEKTSTYKPAQFSIFKPTSSQSTSLVGSSITAGNNVTLSSGQNLSVSASTVKGDATVQLEAKNDITLGSQASTSSYSNGKKRTSSVTQAGSNVSGENVVINAGNDLTLVGSNVNAQKDAAIEAGGDIALLASENEQHFYEKKTSSGSFGRSTTKVNQTDSTTLTGSSITAGGNIAMQAGADAAKGQGNIVMQASDVAAKGNVNMGATGSVIVASGTESNYSMTSKTKKGFFSSSASKKQEGSTTNVASSVFGNNVNINAGESVLISGSQVHAENDLGVKADKGDVTVTAAQDSYWSKEEKKKSKINLGNIIAFDTIMALTSGAALPYVNFEFASKSTEKGVSSGTTNVASALTAGNNMTVSAGQDVSVVGSALQAKNDLSLLAERDVNVIAGQEQSASEYSKKKETIGVSNTYSANWATKSFSHDMFIGYEAKQNNKSALVNTPVQSLVTSGNNLTIKAGQDINQIGSTVAAQQDVDLAAGRDINLLPGEKYSESSASEKITRLGLSVSETDEKASALLGYSRTSVGGEATALNNMQSHILAGGSISATAGDSINIVASELNAGKNITLDAVNNVRLLAGEDVSTATAYQRSVSAGIKANISQNVTPAIKKTLIANQNIYDNVMAGLKLQDVSGLQKEATGAMDAVKEAFTPKFSVSVGLGVDVSSQRKEASSSVPVPTVLVAGGDTSVTAGKDITLEATQMKSQGDTTLKAGENIDIYSVAGTQKESSKTSTANGFIGVAANYSPGSGWSGQVQSSPSGSPQIVGITISGGGSSSRSNADAIVQQNANIWSGGLLTMETGKDLRVQGANIEGENVKLNVGENFLLASVRDGANAKSSNVSGSATVSIGFGGGVSGSASFNADQAKSSSNFIGTQTSIIGREGVDAYVGKNTHIEGAVLAAKNDNLLLDTGTLSFADMKSQRKSTSMGISLNAERTIKNEEKKEDDKSSNTALTTNKDEKKEVDNSSIANNSLKKLTFNYATSTVSQTAYATVGSGTIIVRDNPGQDLSGLNRDQSNTMQLKTDRDISLTIDAMKVFSNIEKGIKLDPTLLGQLDDLGVSYSPIQKKIDKIKSEITNKLGNVFGLVVNIGETPQPEKTQL